LLWLVTARPTVKESEAAEEPEGDRLTVPAIFQVMPSAEVEAVMVVPARVRRTQPGRPALAMVCDPQSQFATFRHWKARPLPGVAKSAANGAVGSEAPPARIMMPALVQASVFCTEAIRAVIVPSADRDCHAYWKPIEEFQMSAPDPVSW
jgi:hypothetical protein